MPISEYGTGLRGAAFSVLIAILATAITLKSAGVERDTIADSDLDITSESTFSVILSMAVVLGLFSGGVLRAVGLTATPLPAGLLFVAALTGISLARGGAFIDGDSIVKCIFAAVLSPMLGALTCYSLCRIIDGDIVNTLIVLGLAGLVAGVVLYLQWQARNNLRKQIVRNREQQVYNTRKSLSALEVKAEMTEKDLLGKLEIKRKELVDFAVGVSDQKRFMEKFYDDLRAIRALPEGPERNAGLDRLLSTLRERMYFSREMNDFYARTEVLHKDFNMRLAEAYPKLTENERRLANLLRQGFSSKYIASLMNITPKSAEINRYRLRAKLGLKREDNLVQFIKSI
jgi:DNA-binding CsgD family transcriptional regulator